MAEWYRWEPRWHVVSHIDGKGQHVSFCGLAVPAGSAQYTAANDHDDPDYLPRAFRNFVEIDREWCRRCYSLAAVVVNNPANTATSDLTFSDRGE